MTNVHLRAEVSNHLANARLDFCSHVWLELVGAVEVDLTHEGAQTKVESMTVVSQVEKQHMYALQIKPKPHFHNVQ